MNESIKGLFDYIESSPCSFHAAQNAAQRLKAAGFTELLESDIWELQSGKGYYVCRNQASIIAFRVPETVTGFMIGAAHTDSPCLKLKENMEITAEGYTKVDGERYGGMLLGTWMDRPLSVAGRLLLATETGTTATLVDLERDMLTIPSLAIHMDRGVNEGKKWDVQRDMLPVMGKGDRKLLPMLAEKAGAAVEDILSFDLYLYNRDKGTVLGPEEELILCPRLDDLMCVYGLLEGFLRVENPKAVSMVYFCDNEEVGSMTRHGAMSTFLGDVMRRICASQGLNDGDFRRCIAQSLLVSADNAHGVHPNHPEKAALTNRPKLGEGIVIKYGARYATDGASSALVRKMMKDADVPTQTYFNHSNVAGGGTIGNIVETQVSMHTVDIGVAQWAMHSAAETAGAADLDHLIRAMETVFSKKLTEVGAETFVIE